MGSCFNLACAFCTATQPFEAEGEMAGLALVYSESVVYVL